MSEGQDGQQDRLDPGKLRPYRPRAVRHSRNHAPAARGQGKTRRETLCNPGAGGGETVGDAVADSDAAADGDAVAGGDAAADGDDGEVVKRAVSN